MSTVINAAICLLPVMAFLGALRYFDSFKLVRHTTLWVTLGLGMAIAPVASLIQELIIHQGWSDSTEMTRFVAPIQEEIFKCAVLAVLLFRGRAGFVLDAAIYGFALGAGFSLMENLLYLALFDEAGLATWLVRGFGTSIMHGGTVALFGVMTKMLDDTKRWSPWLKVILGMVLAMGIHVLFNQFYLPPISMALLIMVTLPPLLIAAFIYSERQTKKWLGAGIDQHMELLNQLLDGDIEGTPLGKYFDGLRQAFAGPLMADVMGYLRMRLELSVQAKAVLLMRENGLEPPKDDNLKAMFEEMSYLKKNIGKTGVRALMPLIGGDREEWQIGLLQVRTGEDQD